MSQSVITLDTDLFQRNLEKNATFVVRLWAPWCAPCRMMSPIFSEVAERLTNESLIFGEVNIDEFPMIAAQLGVRSIPTVVVFQNGQEVNRSAGLMPADQLDKLVHSVC